MIQVARIGDRVIAHVRVGDVIVIQVGNIVEGSARILAESSPLAYFNAMVVFPSTVGRITGNISNVVLVDGKNTARLGSTVTGGAIVGSGQVFTAAQRVLAA